MENFIKTYKVSEEVCDEILDFFWKNKHAHLQGKVGRGGEIVPEFKDSTDLPVPLQSFGYLKNFFDVLLKSGDDYMQKFVHNCPGGAQVGIFEWPNIQLYKKGGGYPSLHYENDGPEVMSRVLVWMLYLTDTPNAGTAFPFQGVTTECKKGDLIIWPAQFTHQHHGIVSKEHEKIIFTGWMNWIDPRMQNMNPDVIEKKHIVADVDEGKTFGNDDSIWTTMDEVTEEDIAEMEKRLGA